MREITQETIFDLRWLTKRYYKKKGFKARDISHWQYYKNPSIKRMLGKNSALILKDASENPYGIALIKDWKRVIGVNQCYQVEWLKDRLKKEDIEINHLRFILVSKMGFSDSTERFANKHKIDLISERDISYEYPSLGEFIRGPKQTKENEIGNNKEKEDAETLSEDNLEDIHFSYRKDADKETLQ